jgi:lipopolysaccharide/colanic/teichoic acid biosynthesis glycosyltransferase
MQHMQIDFSSPYAATAAHAMLGRPAAQPAGDIGATVGWLLEETGAGSGGWLVKRSLDVILASLLLLVTAPILCVAAVLIRLSGPGPVLFRQERTGYRGRPFTIYKLRTMTDGAALLQDELHSQDSGRVFFKVHNDPRITPVGRILRRTSIDELPQLFNVVRGDMSLIGPRPLSATESERLVWPRDRRRFAVPPGITGLWQVSGRSLLPDEERVQLDVRYVEQWSLLLDLEILLRTLPVVVTGRGAV